MLGLSKTQMFGSHGWTKPRADTDSLGDRTIGPLRLFGLWCQWTGNQRMAPTLITKKGWPTS